jgi:hypothetical protein
MRGKFMSNKHWLLKLGVVMLGAALLLGPADRLCADDRFIVVPIAAMTFKGDWNVSTVYQSRDVVFFNGSSWFSLESPNQGYAPDVSPNQWTMLVQKGDVGAAGAQGPQGPTGPQGPEGPIPSNVTERKILLATENKPLATYSFKTYPASQTGTNDAGWRGYNLADTVWQPNDIAEPMLIWGQESNYFNTAEMYMRYVPVGVTNGSFLNILFANIDRATNKILNVQLNSENTTFFNTDFSIAYIQLTPKIARFNVPVTVDNNINAIENAAALLQLVSTDKGFLPPVMTTAQRLAIASPPEGLQVYDTDLHTICFYKGTNWQKVISSSAD